MNHVKVPDLGIGIGLRPCHYSDILSSDCEIDWFEIISENYMVEGGRPLRILDQILERFPVVLHGVSLGIGSPTPLDWDYLKKLKALAKKTKTPWVSDHLCWGKLPGTHYHDLLPLPQTPEVLSYVAERARVIQDFLELPFALENLSSYVEFQEESLTEWEFYSQVVEEGEIFMMLDVNNIYVSSRNHGFDPLDYVARLPLERVLQIHLAGHTDKGAYVLDTHDNYVRDEVWDLYRQVYPLTQGVSTLLEWDDNFVSFEETCAEAKKAKKVKGETKEELITLPSPKRKKGGAPASVPKPLQSTQRWFADVITRPLSAYQQSSFARENQELTAHWIKPSPTLEPFERIELYSQQYWWRLVACLEESFPGLARLFGHGAFAREIAVPYLRKYPPYHWNLNLLGEKLQRYLRDAYSREDFVLVTKMAQADWVFEKIFTEKLSPSLRASPKDLSELVEEELLLQASVELLDAPFDLLSFRSELLTEDVGFWAEQPFPNLDRSNPCFYVVFRNEKNFISWERIAQEEHQVLCQFKEKSSILQALNTLDLESGGKLLANQVSSWVQKWVEKNWLSPGEVGKKNFEKRSQDCHHKSKGGSLSHLVGSSGSGEFHCR